jgi:stage II sporulation protein D
MLRLRLVLVWLLVISSLILFHGCRAESKYSGFGSVKVRLSEGDATCSIGSKGRITIRNFPSGRAFVSSTFEQPVTIKYSSKGIIVGDELYKVDALMIEPGGNSPLIVNGHAYRGTISLHRLDSALTIINDVEIEDYVKGVMANEMLASTDDEALKAQAVVIRSFGIYHMLRYKDRLYSIEAGKILYKGKDTEDPRTNKAVDATRGEVVYYNDALLLPHFSTACGGYTEYAGNVWEASFIFPKPVPCPYCRNSKEYNWSKKLSRNFIQQKLKKYGIEVKEIKAILPYRKSTFGGRLTHLSLKTGGKTVIVRINDFRLALGPDTIKSGLMNIDNEKEEISFTGKGWGHGIGLCQFGAKSMADLGYSYEAILSYYYPGTKLKRIKY